MTVDLPLTLTLFSPKVHAVQLLLLIPRIHRLVLDLIMHRPNHDPQLTKRTRIPHTTSNTAFRHGLHLGYRLTLAFYFPSSIKMLRAPSTTLHQASLRTSATLHHLDL
ncbi:hypothetical protein BDQ17DRAFT_1382027, partial [Cyathus striatus]